MPTKQYHEYIAEQEARRVRIEQQFKYEPVEQRKLPFWMHSIDRPEKHRETEYVGLALVLITVVILSTLLYYGSK